MATGVLVVCLGQATRLIEYLAEQAKVYRAEITLGIATDTYDAEGRVTSQSAVPPLTLADLERTLEQFRGPIMQTPPLYSALKRKGQPLYKIARRGETVELQPRQVTVYRFELLQVDGPVLQTEIVSSAGTYVRSLAHDLGQILGCGAHLSALRRTAVGSFVIDQAHTLEQLAHAAAAVQDGWQKLLLPAEALVQHLPSIILSEDESRRVQHGQAILAAEPPTAGRPTAALPVRAHDGRGRLVAILRYDEEASAWQPAKVLASSQPTSAARESAC